MHEDEIFGIIFFILYFGFIGTVLIANYILSTIGTYQIAKKKGYNLKWLSFIPFFKIIIFNKLMDKDVKWIFKNRLNIWMVIVPVVINILAFVGGFTLAFIGEFAESDPVLGIAFLFVILFYIFTMFLSLLWFAIYMYVFYEYYRKYSPKYYIAWVVCTFFFGYLTHSIAMVVLSGRVGKEEFENPGINKDNKIELEKEEVEVELEESREVYEVQAKKIELNKEESDQDEKEQLDEENSESKNEDK